MGGRPRLPEPMLHWDPKLNWPKGSSPIGSGRLALPQRPGAWFHGPPRIAAGCFTGPRKECIARNHSTGLVSLCSFNHTGEEGREGEWREDREQRGTLFSFTSGPCLPRVRKQDL